MTEAHYFFFVKKYLNQSIIFSGTYKYTLLINNVDNITEVFPVYHSGEEAADGSLRRMI